MAATLRNDAPLLALLAAAAILPFVAPSPYYLSIGINTLIIVCLAVAFDLVVGRVGALSFAQPVFFGFGAYVAALIATTFGAGFWVEALVAAVGGFALSVAIGIPAFRLSLHSFAIGTLGFATIAQLVAQNWMSVTGGPLCITGIPRAQIGLPFAQFTPRTLTEQYFLILAIAALTVFVVRQLIGRRIGLAFSAVRDDPTLAASQGIRPLSIRLSAFGAAAALSAIAGVFTAHFQGVVCPDSVATSYTVMLLIVAFVGGRGSLRGVLAAAIIFGVAPQLLRVADEWRLAIFGALLLVTVLTVPDGIERIFQLIERALGLGGRNLVPAAIATGPAAIPAEPAPATTQAPVPVEVPVGEALPGGALQVTGLRKTYGGVTAVNDLDFEVKAGELVSLIGPNGSGKSTTLDCISGLSPFDAGTIVLDGQNISGWSPARLAKAGLVRTFQATRVYTTLTPRENLVVAALGRAPTLYEWRQYARSRGATPGLDARIDDILGRLGLAAMRDRPTGELSYGQRKLVQFAASVIVPPRILLLDEPLAGVNPTIGNIFKQQIVAFNRRGLTIVLVEHNLEVVVDVSHRLIVLDRGTKIAEGDPRTVMAQAHVQEAYLGR